MKKSKGKGTFSNRREKVKMRKVFTPFNRPEGVKTVYSMPSKTVQGLENEVNIRQILARAKNGMGYPVNRKQALFGDFTGVSDYHQALNRLNEINDEFQSLPAAVKQRFKNDPHILMSFLADERNRKEAEELGIIEAKPEEKPAIPAKAEAPTTIPS